MRGNNLMDNQTLEYCYNCDTQFDNPSDLMDHVSERHQHHAASIRSDCDDTRQKDVLAYSIYATTKGPVVIDMTNDAAVNLRVLISQLTDHDEEWVRKQAHEWWRLLAKLTT